MKMDSPEFDENAEEQYMPSRWGFNLKGGSRIERYLHLCDIQNQLTTRFHSVEHVTYGPDERQGLNILRTTQHHPDNQRAVVLVFVHGGYWIEGDRHMHNFIANGLCTHSVDVVSLGYRLAVNGEDIACCIDDVVAGIQKVQEIFSTSRIYLAGHSAGAHLILSSLAKLTSLKGICKAFCISGIYSLAEIVHTSVGVQLQLKENQVQMFSVYPLQPCYSMVDVHILVGQFDPPEFHKQAQKFADRLQMNNCLKIPVQILPNEDHFSLIENLYFGDSKLAQYLSGCYR